MVAVLDPRPVLDFRVICATPGLPSGSEPYSPLGVSILTLKGRQSRADKLVHDPLMPCEGSWEPCTVTKSGAKWWPSAVILPGNALTETARGHDGQSRRRGPEQAEADLRGRRGRTFRPACIRPTP